MSLSSLAQNSALRLTAPSTSRREIVEQASDAAARAAATNATPAEAKKMVEDAAEGAEKAKEVSVPSGPLAQLVTYVPTETLTLYVALQAALGDVTAPEGGQISDADFTPGWVWLSVFSGFTFLLTIGLSYRAQKNKDADKKFSIPWFESFAAVAAFLVWAFALPSTPLRDFAGFDYSAWNAFIILAGTVAIAVTAYVFGKDVSWEKVIKWEDEAG